MSSSDGFCSTLSFAAGELGHVYTGPTGPGHTASSNTPSANVTPLPTPTQIPLSPVRTSHTPAGSGASGPSTSQPPASPARSNSTSSIATQSTSQTATVVNNPTPTLGSVPLVTATHSAQPSALPLTTPPQTPLPTPTPGVATSNSSVLGKRDARAASESEREESKAPDSGPQQSKKRRVAPTLISTGSNAQPSSKDDDNKGH